MTETAYATLARKASFRGVNRIGRSDMHPDAVEPQAEQPLLLVGAVEHLGQREFAGRRVGEQRRRHDRGTRIDERNHLMFPALAQRAVGQHGVIAAAAIADAARGRRHQQQDIHARGIEGFGQPRQIGPHAIDPQRVGVDVEERRVAEQRQRLDDAAAGAEHFVALIRDGHAGPLARSRCDR